MPQKNTQIATYTYDEEACKGEDCQNAGPAMQSYSLCKTCSRNQDLMSIMTTLAIGDINRAKGSTPVRKRFIARGGRIAYKQMLF